MAGIRTWIPESDILKPGETSSVQEIRTWFERLPRMRALIRQKQEHIERCSCFLFIAFFGETVYDYRV